MNKIKYLTLAILFSLPLLSFGQSGRLKYADKMYESQSYYYAAEAYEDVVARKTDSMVVADRIASSYDKMKNVSKAVRWYKYIDSKGELKQNQLLRMALLERGLENYREYDNLIARYKDEFGSDGIAADLLNHPPIETLEKNKGWFSIKKQDVNTEFSEMGVSYLSENEIILSSSQRTSLIQGRTDSWTGDYFYDIYRAPIDDQGIIGKMKLVNSSEVKSKFHDGPAAFNPKNGYLYFTRNNFVKGEKGTDDNEVSRLKIYRAKIDGEKFIETTELNINSDNYSTAHPTISADGSKMFFSSDRPGGFGGMDIYAVELAANGLPRGEPVNLGEKVNTSESEVFPFYNQDENLLFFSSEGHFGLGGLDIYVARLNDEGKVRNIENLGVPINSSYDDFSFINDEAQTKGYYASNRKGGLGADDIYGFTQNVKIRNVRLCGGMIKDIVSMKPIEGAEVSAIDKSGKVLATTTSMQDGSYELQLDELSDDFYIVANKDTYVEGKKNMVYDASTSDYIADINLAPVLDYYFTGIIKDKKNGEKLSGVMVKVIDNNTGKEFASFTTDESGSFKTTTLPYKYQDKASYDFKLQKPGFVSKTVTLNEVLALEEEIKVDQKISLDLTLPEDGITDLNDVSDISPILFDLNSSFLRSDATKGLDVVVRLMKDNPGMVIKLKAHTDSRADDDYNMWLSDRRADRSMEYIIKKGIDPSRVSAEGLGETQLKVSDAEIAKASSEAEKERLHQMNRRTEFIVVKMN